MSDTRVNTTTLNAQYDPAVAMDANGDFVGAASTSSSDGSLNAVDLEGFLSNASPLLALPLADQTAAEGTAVSFTIPAGSFTDPDNDALTLSATRTSGAALPSWLTFNPTTRSFSGTPPFDASGSLTIRVTATDGGGATASDDFTLSIANTNRAPALVEPLAYQAAAPGTAFSFAIPSGSFVDPDSSRVPPPLSATLANGAALPSWLTFTPSTRTFSGTAPLDTSVNLMIRVTATDAAGATAFDEFALAVRTDTRVNTFTTGYQWEPAVAMDANGDFVVVWEDLDQDVSGSGIYAQRYNASGAAIGGEFRVNDDPDDLPSEPAVAMDAAGNFVVVWMSAAGVRFDIFAQRYSAGGLALGPEFRVNTMTTLDQFYPAVAMDADGDFVVVWDYGLFDGSPGGIFGRRFNSAGVPVGLDFQINTATTDVLPTPDIAMDSYGNFVVVWEGLDGNSSGIHAQRFNAAGVAIGGEFRVNTTTAGSEINPAVAMDSDGNFVVVWQGAWDIISAQRYNSDGVAVGGEFRVNTSPTDVVSEIAVAMEADGDFVVTWESIDRSSGSVSVGIYAQRYTAAGVPNGREFLVNAITAGLQSYPAVAIDNDGDFVIAWEHRDEDDIYLNRFSSNALPVLAIALADQTAAENAAFSFTIPAGHLTDPDAGDALTLTARLANGATLPSWLTFNRATSTFSGTPPYDASGTLIIRVTATDLIGATASDDFTLTIANTNRAPALAAALADRIAAEGMAVSFTIPAGSFTDPDGDALTLSATLANGAALPSWLTFNPATLTFSGTAPLDALGSMPIRVTATDGGGATASDEFSLAVGAEIRANTYTAGHQQDPAVAVGAAGNFVVVWTSSQDLSLDGIYAQRFNASGVALGSEFRVNTTTANSQSNAAVAMDADGDFVITWESPDGSSDGVYAQRYSAAGLAVGSEFRVNTTTASDQGRSAVAMDADGDFVITWESFVQDGSGDGIYAQRYNAAGVALGGEFRVNTTTASSQNNPAVAMDAAGNFVIAWDSPHDGSGDGIYAQRYNAAGLALGGEFRVNTTTSGSQNNPAVAMDSNGSFIVTWDSPDGSSDGIYAQRYNAAGVALGGEFRVNTTTVNDQADPTVAMDASGDFVIIWRSNGQDGSGDGIYAQRYNAAGIAIGGEIQVNTFTSSDQQAPAVAMDANGNITVAWESLGQDGSGYGIYFNLLGDGGDNTLVSSPGADLLSGGAGDDWASYTLATSAVTVDLGAGSSSGGHGIDQLISIDAVLGGAGADSLVGDAGSNTLHGGAGADTIVGGAGNDLFFVTDAGDLVMELASGGVDTIIASTSMAMPNHVEALRIAEGVSGITITGSAGNDMLIGNGLANNFNGGAGDDVILAGNVTLADIHALFAT
jgi:hypothetical protein